MRSSRDIPLGYRRPCTGRYSTASITQSARETSSVDHVRMPAKWWMLGRHEKWAVDVVSGRDHREVRQGVCEAPKARATASR